MYEENEIEEVTKDYPSIKQAIYLALRFLLYSIAAGMIVTAVPGALMLKPTKELRSLLLLIGYVVPMLAVIWVGFTKFKKSNGSSLRLKFRKAPAIAILVSCCIILTMPVLTDPLDVLLPMPDAWKKIFADMVDNNIFSMAAVSLAAPILEEIFFRGIILNGLLKRYPPQTAIITSAAIFALIHLNPWQAVPAFLGGLLMGWMYWKTNSIVPGMILHFVNNSFAVAMGVVFKGADTIKELLSTPVYIGLYVACAAVLLGGWTFLEYYFEQNPTPEEEEPETASLVETE